MAVSPGQVPDCLFYGSSPSLSWSTLATDLSGEADNLTAAVSWIYELSSARSNLTERRTIGVGIEHNDTLSGALYRWGRTSTEDILSIALDVVTLTVNGSVVLTYTIQDISGTTDDFYIIWAMEPNPGGSGATAMRSELQIHNASNNAYEQATATHAQPTAGSSGTLVFAADSSSGANNYEGDMFMARMSSAFHSSVEGYETFIAQSSAPTLIGSDRKPFAMPTRGDVALGDDGQFAGPVYIMGARAVEQHTSLLWSPLVNEIAKETGFMPNQTTTGGQTVGYYDSDLDMAYRIEWLYRRPVPPGVNFLVPTIHVQQALTAGSPHPLRVFAFSMSQPGPLVRPLFSPPTFERYYVADETITADHGTTLTGGVWVELPKLKVARDNLGMSYLCVGIGVDDGEGASARVRAVSFDPVFVAAGDGLGVGGFG